MDSSAPIGVALSDDGDRRRIRLEARSHSSSRRKLGIPIPEIPAKFCRWRVRRKTMTMGMGWILNSVNRSGSLKYGLFQCFHGNADFVAVFVRAGGESSREHFP
eukprot:scaffold24250_cov61-Attheya_sp.AAC.3